MKGRKQVQVDVDITDMPLGRVIDRLRELEGQYGKEAYLELEQEPYSDFERIVLTYYRHKTQEELDQEARLQKAKENARKALYESLKAEFEGE